MKTSSMLMVLAFIFAYGCNNRQSAQDHESAHAETGSHSHESDGRPTVEYTAWSKQFELFVSFPALVAGEKSEFTAHATVLKGHAPVREGSLKVRLQKGTSSHSQIAEAPSSPGIFTPVLQPKEAGPYQLTFALNSGALSDTIVLKGIAVYANAEEAHVALSGPQETEKGISFLKEQAWEIDFQTSPVVKKQVYQSIATAGQWLLAPEDNHTVIAPASGRLSFSRTALTEGAAVRQGQVLMTINSSGLANNNLNAEIEKARAAYEQAKSEYQRKKTLHADKIVPQSEFEHVEQKYQVAKTDYETLISGQGASGKQVVAPINGFIKSLAAKNGAYASQGDVLLQVGRHENSLLQVMVNPKYSAELQHIQNLWYQPRPGKWSSLQAQGGQILSVSKEVSAEQPLLAVNVRVNEIVEMPEGSFTEAQIAAGTGHEGLVIPVSALLEDYGQYSVIVQLGGESYARRNVQLGMRNGNEVEVVKGLSEGERVVSQGAFQVKMASMASQAPAHGHTH